MIMIKQDLPDILVLYVHVKTGPVVEKEWALSRTVDRLLSS